MVRYSWICEELERELALGVEAISGLHRQIVQLIVLALAEIGLNPDHLIRTAGDGAILVFPLPETAERFATAFHRLAFQRHNRFASRLIDYRIFRIGISTGQILHAHRDLAGVAVCRAARLEAAALPGEILIDANTWPHLSSPLRLNYGPEETIPGKAHDRSMQAHRRRVCPPGPWNEEP